MPIIHSAVDEEEDSHNSQTPSNTENSGNDAIENNLKQFFALQLINLKNNSGAEVERITQQIRELKQENMRLYLAQQQAQVDMYKYVRENLTQQDRINLLLMQVNNLKEDNDVKRKNDFRGLTRNEMAMTDIQDVTMHFITVDDIIKKSIPTLT